MCIRVFSTKYLDDIVDQAAVSPRRRQHRNIHTDYADPCQRLFNAIEPDSYLRPHRHGTAQGAETMIAVRGLMALIVFGDGGGIDEIHRFGAGYYVQENRLPVGVEIPPACWHTVLALAPGSVLLEMKAGPFNPDASKFHAPWAPEEGGEAGRHYLSELREKLIHGF